MTVMQDKDAKVTYLTNGVEVTPRPTVLPAQDKDAKVTYLTKIINVVSIALGQAVPAKPLKVRFDEAVTEPHGGVSKPGRGGGSIYSGTCPAVSQPVTMDKEQSCACSAAQRSHPGRQWACTAQAAPRSHPGQASTAQAAPRVSGVHTNGLAQRAMEQASLLQGGEGSHAGFSCPPPHPLGSRMRRLSLGLSRRTRMCSCRCWLRQHGRVQQLMWCRCVCCGGGA